MKKSLLALTLTTVLLVGCSDENNINNDPVAVKFTAKVGSQEGTATPVGRATETDWDINDAIGIYMVENNTKTILEGVANKKYTTPGGDGTFEAASAGDEIYFPVNQPDAVDFMAYYPQTDAVTGFIYPVNVANQQSQAAIDLLFADSYLTNTSGYSKLSPNVNIVFNHKLTRFILNTVPGDGLEDTDLEDMTVTIVGMNTRTTFNMEQDDFGAANTQENINPAVVDNGKRYEAILIPASIANDGDWRVEFTVHGNTYVWNIPGGTELKSGYEHEWEISVQKTPVALYGSITPWNINTVESGIAD